jgi:steroid delta-isomerase-like uncharacterized protein
MSAENAELVRRWFEDVWNHRRAEAIDELLTDESVCHADQGPMRGPAGFREQQVVPFLSAFPDLRVEIEAILAEGDQVAVRWRAEGTHTGGGIGLPPTNRPASFRGISWICVREGKFCEGWQVSNIPEVVRSLAAPPA